MHRSGRRNSTDSVVGVEPAFSAPVRSPTTTTSGSSLALGPVQLGRADGAAMKLAPNAFQRANACSPSSWRGLLFQHSTANHGPMTSSSRTFCCSRVSTRGWMNSVPTARAGRRRRARVHDGALLVARHRLEPHLEHIALERRHDRGRADHLVAQRRNAPVGRRDDPAHHGRQVDHRAGVLAPFDVVGVQQRVAGLPVDHRGQLPARGWRRRGCRCCSPGPATPASGARRRRPAAGGPCGTTPAMREWWV